MGHPQVGNNYCLTEPRRHCSGLRSRPDALDYERESQLYADIEAGESGALRWSDPNDTSWSSTALPVPLLLTEAMAMLGIFTPGGLKATSEIWDQVEFADQEGQEDAERLTQELVNRLIQEELPSEKVSDEHVRTLFGFWQLPMYNLDFKIIPVSMEELEAEREYERGTELWGLI